MSLVAIDLDEWMAVMAQAAGDIARGALGWPGCQVSDEPCVPAPTCGAYVPLIDHGAQLQIGLVADDEGCQLLARALLGLSEGEPPVPPADVADAVGEIVNMLAGGLKRRMQGRIGSLVLGLPIFIRGYVEATEKLEIARARVQLGPVTALALVLRHRV